MNRIQRDTLLGIVFFGTMAFLLWATVNLTDMSFNKVPALLVYFDNGVGIRVGDPVLLLGKPVGKVSDIQVMKDRADNRVRLTLRVDEELGLTVAQKIEIQTSGALGGKQVFVDPGRGDQWPKDRELV